MTWTFWSVDWPPPEPGEYTPGRRARLTAPARTSRPNARYRAATGATGYHRIVARCGCRGLAPPVAASDVVGCRPAVAVRRRGVGGRAAIERLDTGSPRSGTPARHSVTGGAGLIGSHMADCCCARAGTCASSTTCEPQTHRDGKPAWVPAEAEFIGGRHPRPATVSAALDGVDVVFHQAAYGGYMPEIAKYVAVNGFGTALMLENDPRREAAGAQGRRRLLAGGLQRGRVPLSAARPCLPAATRPVAQLRARRLAECTARLRRRPRPAPTDEAGAERRRERSTPSPRLDQERLMISWGRQTGIPTVALRYSCTYGPRQSLFNPYTGRHRDLRHSPAERAAAGALRRWPAVARLLLRRGRRAGQPAGALKRCAAMARRSTSAAGGPTTIRDVATTLAERRSGCHLAPVARGEFRPGEDAAV